MNNITTDNLFFLGMTCKVNILYDLDETILLTAARLMARHPLSASDALIAAYAIRLGAVLVHRDPKWEALSGSVPMEALPQRERWGRSEGRSQKSAD